MSSPAVLHLLARNLLGPSPNPNPIANVKEHFSAIEGPWLVAGVLQAFLMGIIVVQAHDYFLLYKTDSKWLRWTVVWLILANLACCCADIYVVYYAFVLSFGEIVKVLSAHAAQFATLFLSPFVAAAVQVFFAVRAFKVNQNLYVALVMGLLILTSLGAWLAVAIESLIAGVEQARLSHILTFVQVAGWSTAGTDVVISAVFVSQLAKSKKGFSSTTDHIVSRLLAMAVGTAGVTAVIAIVNALSFFLNNSTSSFWIICNWTIPRVYTISMLYVLNSRRSLRFVAEGGNTSTGGEERAGTKSKSRYGRSEGPGLTSGIAVNLETFVTHDVGVEEEEKRGVRF